MEYESTLELMDPRGNQAMFRKREKVRYLQDNIIAYQDQAWGDGKILMEYRCSPGKPVDRYRPGRKTFVLISLREVKMRGDIDEFNIEWGLQNSFTRTEELWETEISHPTKHSEINVIFPASRTPKQVLFEEETHQNVQNIDEHTRRQLPDGRWFVSWELANPRIHERFTIKWKW